MDFLTPPTGYITFEDFKDYKKKVKCIKYLSFIVVMGIFLAFILTCMDYYYGNRDKH